MNTSGSPFRSIARFVVWVYTFQLCFAGTGAVFAYTPSPSNPIDLNSSHYTLNSQGVTFNNSLRVSLPNGFARLSQRDIAVKSPGFDLVVTRVYRGGSVGSGLFGRRWGMLGNKKLDFSSPDRIRVIGFSGVDDFLMKSAQRYSSAGSGDITKDKKGRYHWSARDLTTYTFGSDGRLLARQDSNAVRLVYRYKDGRLAKIINSASNRKLSFTYNKQKLVQSITDDLGGKVSYVYDKSERLVKVKRFGIQSTSYEYNDASLLKTVFWPGGDKTSISYRHGTSPVVKRVDSGGGRSVLFAPNAKQNLISVKDSFGARYRYKYLFGKNSIEIRISGQNQWETKYLYSKENHLLSWTSPTRYKIDFRHDSMGRVTVASDNRGVILKYKYKGANPRPVEIRDSRGPVSSFEYDSKNNLVQVRRSGHDPIFMTWHPSGILKSMTQGKKTVIASMLNKTGDEVSKKSGTLKAATFSYDRLGRVIGKTDPYGLTTRYAYNGLGQFVGMEEMTAGASNSLKMEYDSAGILNRIAQSDGKVMRYVTNRKTKTSKVILPGGVTYTMRSLPGAKGTTNTTIYPNNSSKSFALNSANQLTYVTDDFGATQFFTWASSRLPKRITNADGSYVDYSYNGSGKVVEKNVSGGSVFKYRYKDDHVASVQSTHFHQEYGYSKQTGALETIHDKKLGLSIGYTYTGRGKVRSVEISGVGKISYSYNANNLLEQITDPDGRKTFFTYDQAGRTSRILYPNGVIQNYSYKPGSQPPSAITVTSKDGNVLFSEKYFYNNQYLSRTDDQVAGSVKKYSYDQTEALSKFERKSKRDGSINLTYSYDTNGNIRTETGNDDKTVYRYDGIGRLIQRGGTTLTYNKRGALVSKKSDKNTTRYTYNANGNLTSAFLPDGSRKIYRYDYKGRLIFVKNGTLERHILWDAVHPLLELDGNKKLVKLYIHGEIFDQLVSVREGKSPRYYHQDRQGSVRLVTDGSGRKAGSYEYLPFGELLTPAESLAKDRYYAGRPYDADLESYYMRARFYSPEFKRFTSVDPVAGTALIPQSMHPYLYALNNPLNYGDPTGEFLATMLGAAAFGVFIVAGVAYTLVKGGGIPNVSSVRLRDTDEETFEASEKHLEELPGQLDKFGKKLDTIKNFTDAGGALGAPVSSVPFDPVTLSDPNKKKAESARGQALSGLISSLPGKIVGEGIKGGIGTGNLGVDFLPGMAVDEGVKKGEKAISDALGGKPDKSGGGSSSSSTPPAPPAPPAPAPPAPAGNTTGNGDDGTGTSDDGTGTSGGDTGTSGDDTGASGDGTGTSGDGTGTSGDGTGTSGDGTGTSGDGTGTSGDGTGTSGDGTGTSGDGTGTSGDGTGTSGDGTGTSGDGTGTSGDGGSADDITGDLLGGSDDGSGGDSGIPSSPDSGGIPSSPDSGGIPSSPSPWSNPGNFSTPGGGGSGWGPSAPGATQGERTAAADAAGAAGAASAAGQGMNTDYAGGQTANQSTNAGSAAAGVRAGSAVVGSAIAGGLTSGVAAGVDVAAGIIGGAAGNQISQDAGIAPTHTPPAGGGTGAAAGGATAPPNVAVVKDEQSADASGSGGQASGPQDRVIDLSSKVPPGGRVIKIKVTLSYDAYGIKDTFQILYQGALLFNSGKISGSGTKTVVANGSSPKATIRVYSPDNNTAWKWSAKTKIAIIKPAAGQ